MTSVFPIELYEQIIDAVASCYPRMARPHRDKTLQSCALTCTAWLPRSRMNLYRSVSFAAAGSAGLHRFARLLDSATHLQPLVSEVKLTMGDHPLGAGPETREAIEILPIILCGRLPNIRSLRVSAMNRNGAPLALHRAFFPCITQFATVTKLVLYNVTFARFSDFAQMILSLGNLQTLDCGQVDWLAWRSFSFPSQGITRLILQGFEHEHMQGNALDRHVCGVLNLVNGIISSLFDLTLDTAEFSHLNEENVPLSAPFLRVPCLSIHTLRLNIPIDELQPKIAEAAATTLSSVSFTNLRTIILSFQLFVPTKAKMPERILRALAKNLDSTLSGWSSRDLAQVVFLLEGHVDESSLPQWSQLVERLFPVCSKRGIVRIGVQEHAGSTYNVVH
ncbi:hypothetical protein C8Q80DRAFT_376110 [Daedaleopsis nitida]|nr:hypothetical protein C8Q80DRAFT_376110 [Daedaleopsis nitida]